MTLGLPLRQGGGGGGRKLATRVDRADMMNGISVLNTFLGSI